MNKKDAGLAKAIGLAGVWFGLHCGGGFATGAQGLIYFTQYGPRAIWSSIFSGLLMAGYAYVLWEFARAFETTDYRALYNKLFEPYNKVFATIHEILYMIILVMAMGAVFSGSAELFVNILGMSYVVGALLISFIVFMLTIYGKEFFFRSSTALSVILVSLMFIICITGIIKNWGNVSAVIAQRDAQFSNWAMIKSAIIYASFQSTVLCGTVSVSDSIVTKKDTRMAAAFGFLFNGVMMLLLVLMTLGYYPGIIGEALPVLNILRDLDVPILVYAYYTVLFLAFITTAITLVFSIVTRFEKYGIKLIPDLAKRRKVYSFLTIAVCFFISLVGLLGIIGKGYGAVGYLGIPFVVIPTFIIGPIKIKKKLAGKVAAE